MLTCNEWFPMVSLYVGTIRSPADGTSSNANKARKPELIARYKNLEMLLYEKEEYSDPVCK